MLLQTCGRENLNGTGSWLWLCLPVELQLPADVIGQLVILGGRGQRQRFLCSRHGLVELARRGVADSQCVKDGHVLIPC
ncbi:hypothetical protein ES703_118378 [subsurface metagenome]